MKQVLRTISSYFPAPVSGPANQAREISRRLVPLGYESTIITTRLNAGDAPKNERLDGISIVRMPLHASFMQYYIALGILPELRRSRADVIHAHGHRNFYTDAAAWVARKRKIPFILHLHGTLASYRKIAPPPTWWLYRGHDLVAGVLGVLQADRIIVSTNEERAEAESYGVDPQRISIIPMGIDINDYIFPDIPRDPQRIVFVGRLTEDRNPELLLRALALISNQSWTCTLVGDETRRSYATKVGYIDQLKQLVCDLGIAERVIFTGQLCGEKLRQEYARAGIFVYPSRSENFGQTILEAAAAGCALVTSPVGVAHDLITEGVSGFFIKNTAPEDLARHISIVLESPERQRMIGEKARSRVCHAYAWESILQRYISLYDETIDQYAERKARF